MFPPISSVDMSFAVSPSRRLSLLFGLSLALRLSFFFRLPLTPGLALAIIAVSLLLAAPTLGPVRPQQEGEYAKVIGETAPGGWVHFRAINTMAKLLPSINSTQHIEYRQFSCHKPSGAPFSAGRRDGPNGGQVLPLPVRAWRQCYQRFAGRQPAARASSSEQNHRFCGSCILIAA
jgi:hypothetical protein